MHTHFPIQIKAPAKLNLILRILGQRPDGYHEIETLMVPINRYDVIHIRKAAQFSLCCDDPTIPTDATNTITRAYREIAARRGVEFPVEVYLDKHIPAGSGLGGASSDAAAFLKGLDRCWEIGLTDQEAVSVLSAIGTDTVFFWKSKSAVCTGRGERVQPVHIKREIPFLVSVPNVTAITSDVYKAASKQENWLTTVKYIDIIKSINNINSAECHIGDWLSNHLETVSLALYPSLAICKQTLKNITGRQWHLTGSGSAFYLPCLDEAEALDKLAQVRDHPESAEWTLFTATSLSMKA